MTVSLLGLILKACMAEIHCRFLWTVQYLVGAGFYVIPAYQPSDCSVDNTVSSVPGIFVRNWANLWAAITDLPTYSSM